MKVFVARLVAATGFVASFSVGCGSGSSDLLPDADGPDAASEADIPTGPTGDDATSAAADDAFVPDDTSSFTGLQSDGGPCRPHFASGVNVAWVTFARDVPNPSIPAFLSLFQHTHAAGGRVARWWFHTDGSRTPGYDANGLALPISASNIDDVKRILDTARSAGMMVTISLWSFDMLRSGPIANNMQLLMNDTNRQAYIDNVLTPLVTALKGYPGLYAWETFNEPEGMSTQYGWLTTKIDESYVQKTINWFAAAIHAADPSALVTNGTWQFRANANAAGMSNQYSDGALRQAGGMSGGTLDFYEVHYYAANGASVSPFAFPASHWMLDKPVVVGEFYALAQSGVAAADTYTALFTTGYNGAWAWQYESNDGANTSNGGQPTKWPAMQVPMQNLYDLSPADVDCP